MATKCLVFNIRGQIIPLFHTKFCNDFNGSNGLGQRGTFHAIFTHFTQFVQKQIFLCTRDPFLLDFYMFYMFRAKKQKIISVYQGIILDAFLTIFAIKKIDIYLDLDT